MMQKKVRIIAVCGMGMGTSILAKMSIEEALQGTNYSFEIENADLGSASGYQGDIFVTTEMLLQSFSPPCNAIVVCITNFFNKDEIKEKILPVMEKLCK